ncbi:hypothetical protein Q8A67_000075 [Cirrhinus molitorella]|uniref:Uncharacterized protein n=1 Tax=Cirrhinus molitorella TaxID=172907 RepID=A0AA88U6F4_9TELE|nr:hypothetical protein Q8A67_000075 [Cirrhinus molitorella]
MEQASACFPLNRTKTRCPGDPCWEKRPRPTEECGSSKLHEGGHFCTAENDQCHNVWWWGEGWKMNKARKFINSAIAQYMEDTGEVFMDKEITQKTEELLEWGIEKLEKSMVNMEWLEDLQNTIDEFQARMANNLICL